MTFYVCKQCNYKHTFLPLACAKCKGTNFYPLVTSELTEELKPIDVTKYTVTENGNVIRSKPVTEEPKKNHWFEMYELECLKTKTLEEENKDIQQTCENYYNEMRSYKNKVEDLEKQIEKGRNIVHKLLVIIQRHKWWNYTVIDEARAFMSEVDHDKDHD